MSAFVRFGRVNHSQLNRDMTAIWSRNGIARVLCALPVLAICFGSVPALAVPYVDIRAEWFVDPGTSLPAGLELTCSGNATGGGAAGCSDSLALQTTVTTSQSFSLSSDGGVTLTNTSGGPLTGILVLNIGFSAFNPGGPEIGISIDNPVTQAASFISFVESSVVPVLDAHSCSVGFNGESGTVFSPTTCGVVAPDESQLEEFINLETLGAGESIDLSFALGINADFTIQAVPEPSSFSILLLAMSGLMIAFGFRLRQIN